MSTFSIDLVEDTMIKFFAKRRKEDGRITHLLVPITGGSRRLLDGREWEQEEEYRHPVKCFEQLPLSRAILSPPVVVPLDEWRRYGMLREGLSREVTLRQPRGSWIKPE